MTTYIRPGGCCCQVSDPICNCYIIDAKYDLYDGSYGACWDHDPSILHEFTLPSDYCASSEVPPSWQRNSNSSTFIQCMSDYCDLTDRPCFRFGDTVGPIDDNGYVFNTAVAPDPTDSVSIAYEIWIDTTLIGVSKFAATQGITSSGRFEVRFIPAFVEVYFRYGTGSIGRTYTKFVSNGCHHIVAQWNHVTAKLDVWVDGSYDFSGGNTSPTFLSAVSPSAGVARFGKFNAGTEGSGRFDDSVDLAFLGICDSLFDDDRVQAHYDAGPP